MRDQVCPPSAGYGAHMLPESSCQTFCIPDIGTCLASGSSFASLSTWHSYRNSPFFPSSQQRRRCMRLKQLLSSFFSLVESIHIGGFVTPHHDDSVLDKPDIKRYRCDFFYQPNLISSMMSEATLSVFSATLLVCLASFDIRSIFAPHFGQNLPCHEISQPHSEQA